MRLMGGLNRLLEPIVTQARQRTAVGPEVSSRAPVPIDSLCVGSLRTFHPENVVNFPGCGACLFGHRLAEETQSVPVLQGNTLVAAAAVEDGGVRTRA